MEINERINQIAWIPRKHPTAHHLLTANEKIVKLWRVKDRQPWQVTENNQSLARKLDQTDVVQVPLILPRLAPRASDSQPLTIATPRVIFGNVHAYHINSVSPCADGELFLSADDLRIYMWNFEHSDEAYGAIDLKPEKIDDLNEVITSALFHPTQGHMFAYSTSKGIVQVCDMRTGSTFDHHRGMGGMAMTLDNKQGNSAALTSLPPTSSRTSSPSFIQDSLHSISHFQFNPCNDRLLATRDYLTMKVWDVAMGGKPLQVIPVHDYLKPRLLDLYETDVIFDKFSLCHAHDGKSLLTGSYHNFVRQSFLSHSSVESMNSNNARGSIVQLPDQVIHSDKSIFRTLRKQASMSRSTSSTNTFTPPTFLSLNPNSNGVCEVILDHHQQSYEHSAHSLSPSLSSYCIPFGLSSPLDIDTERKILHLSAHPREPTVAIAATSNLFIFSATGSPMTTTANDSTSSSPGITTFNATTTKSSSYSSLNTGGLFTTGSGSGIASVHGDSNSDMNIDED